MKERIILTLKDCPLIIMNLPPLKGKDAYLAAERQLPAFYPHPLQGRVMDIIRRGNQSLVFLIDKDRLQEIRKKRRNHIEIYSTAQFVPDFHDSAPRICRWSHRDGQDLFLLRGDQWEQAFYTAAGQGTDSLLPFLFPEENPVISELEEPLTKPGGFMGGSRGDPERRSLFQAHKAFLPALLPLLPAITVLFLLTLRFMQYGELKQELTEQERTLKQQNPWEERQKEEYPWEQVQALMAQHVPVDYYTVLESLYPSIKGRGKILTLRIQGQELYLEVDSSEGLLILNDLKSKGLLTQPTLHQMRRYEDRTVLSLSGSLK